MTDFEYMQMAVTAAKKAEWRTWQNPRVGAVIVKDDQVLAVGYHHEFGDNHAEIDAYNQIADPSEVIGATIYVTLEPCAHQGKRPSCAKQMLKWGLARVVIGQIDPNPLVSGKGITYLREGGVQVDIWPTPISESFNPAFHYYFTHQLPYVTVKVAQSINGKINAAPNTATKITDEMVDIDVHQLQAYQQAIIVGSQAALIDHPSLTVRHVATKFQPLRVIVDRRGRLKDSELSLDERTLVYTENQAWSVTSDRIIYLETVTPTTIITDLAKQGVQSVMVEGGAQLHQAFIAAGVYQEAIIYQTTTALPASGQNSFTVTKITALGEVVAVEKISNTLKIMIKKEKA